MVTSGKHHNSALCHISTTLLTRIIACWRAGTPYQIRDTDGTPLTTAQGRAIIAQRYRVSDELRARAAPATPKRDEPATPGVARRSDTGPPPPHATTTSHEPLDTA